MGFHIPKIWQNLNPIITRSFHQAYTFDRSRKYQHLKKGNHGILLKKTIMKTRENYMYYSPKEALETTPAEHDGESSQYFVSTSRPTQTRPPKAGVGFPQDRRRCLVPPPQVREQALKSDHSVHPPC